MSFSAALDQAERLAAALAALGVRRGDVVSVQLPSTPEFVIIYHAIARLGAVLTTLHMAYGPDEAEPILRHARARAVFCSAASDKSDPPGLFTALAQRLPNLQHVIAVGPATDRHTLIRDVNCERRSRRVAAAASGNGCGGDVLHVRNIGGTEGSSP